MRLRNPGLLYPTAIAALLSAITSCSNSSTPTSAGESVSLTIYAESSELPADGESTTKVWAVAKGLQRSSRVLFFTSAGSLSEGSAALKDGTATVTYIAAEKSQSVTLSAVIPMDPEPLTSELSIKLVEAGLEDDDDATTADDDAIDDDGVDDDATDDDVMDDDATPTDDDVTADDDDSTPPDDDVTTTDDDLTSDDDTTSDDDATADDDDDITPPDDDVTTTDDDTTAVDDDLTSDDDASVPDDDVTVEEPGISGIFAARATILVDVTIYITEWSTIKKEDQTAKMLFAFLLERDGTTTAEANRICEIVFPIVDIGTNKIVTSLSDGVLPNVPIFEGTGSVSSETVPTHWNPPTTLTVLGASDSLGLSGTLPFRAEEPLFGSPKCSDGATPGDLVFKGDKVPVCHASDVEDTDKDGIPGITAYLTDTPLLGDVEAYIISRLNIGLEGDFDSVNHASGQLLTSSKIEQLTLHAKPGGALAVKVSPIFDVTGGDFDMARIDGKFGADNLLTDFNDPGVCDIIKQNADILFE